MNDYKWGDTIFNVYTGTYRGPHLEREVQVEIKLLPKRYPDGHTTPATSIQQMGRERYIWGFSGFVESWAEYEALLLEKVLGTERVFEDPWGVVMNGAIKFLGEPVKVLPSLIEYSITFQEGEPMEEALPE